MKKWILMVLVGLCSLSTWAEVTMTNLVVAQRPGTKLVDITYDVSSTKTNTVSVSLSVSNGISAVSATSIIGDVGEGVVTGTGKLIVWDGGADWNENQATLQYTLVAYDMPLGGDPTAVSWEVINDRWVKNTYSDGAITMSDRNTNLIWVYDSDANGTATWNGAKSRCSSLVYADYEDWFLPDANQLLAMHSQRDLFKDVQWAWYWSSTSYSDTWGYGVSMRYGALNVKDGASNSYWVWPCRLGYVADVRSTLATANTDTRDYTKLI